MENAKSKVWAHCSDISERGCYVKSLYPEPVGTKLQINLYFLPAEFVISAVVRSSFPGLGMGVEFQLHNQQQSTALKALIAKQFGRGAQPNTYRNQL